MFGIDDAAIATILAGLVSTAGALYTNKKNRDAQQDANAINWEIARQNNATQIEMANTAHQREVRDLRAAGLNPILSAGGNGSSTPTLSAASINPVHQDNAFEGLANSAKGLSRYMGQQYKANLETVQNQARLLDSQAQQAEIDMQQRSRDVELDNINRDIDIMRSRLEDEELHRLTHIGRYVYVPETNHYAYREQWSPTPELKKWTRQALESDILLRSNANWRANLSSFVPFVSPAAVNSAASAVRGSSLRRLKP